MLVQGMDETLNVAHIAMAVRLSGSFHFEASSKGILLLPTVEVNSIGSDASGGYHVFRLIIRFEHEGSLSPSACSVLHGVHQRLVHLKLNSKLSTLPIDFIDESVTTKIR